MAWVAGLGIPIVITVNTHVRRVEIAAAIACGSVVFHPAIPAATWTSRPPHHFETMITHVHPVHIAAAVA